MNLYQPTITGSLSVSGSVNISGSITIAGGGTISGTASIATTALTASFVANAQTASYVLNAVSSSFALTASSADNLLVRNTLTAQTLVVQTITSSVDFVTGSTRFGSLSSNTHVYTGSMSVSGSFISTGSVTFAGADLATDGLGNVNIFTTDAAVTGRGGSLAFGGGTTGGTSPYAFTKIEGIYDGSAAYNGAMLFSTNNGGTITERMRISSNGTVQITANDSLLVLQAATVNKGIVVEYKNSAATRRGYVGYGGDSSSLFEISNNENGAIDFRTNAAFAMRITSGGNVGIGTTTINASSGYKMLRVNGASGGEFVLANNNTDCGYLYANTGQFVIDALGNFPLRFRTNGGNRMEITASGNVNINGATGFGYLDVGGQANGVAQNVCRLGNISGVNNGLIIQVNSSNNYIYNFGTLGTGTVSASSGVLSASSDMNLKNEDGFVENGLDKVMKLKPRYFYWKEETDLPSDIRQLGFYAQEVNEALGEEVANTPKDNNDKWGIYDRGIIAMLTKAIQELKAEFDEYKTTHP